MIPPVPSSDTSSGTIVEFDLGDPSTLIRSSMGRQYCRRRVTFREVCRGFEISVLALVVIAVILYASKFSFHYHACDGACSLH